MKMNLELMEQALKLPRTNQLAPVSLLTMRTLFEPRSSLNDICGMNSLKAIRLTAPTQERNAFSEGEYPAVPTPWTKLKPKNEEGGMQDSFLGLIK